MPKAPTYHAPSGMTLYDFQKELVDELAPARSCLVGDDMGLGKTYEGIALDQMRRRNRSARTLVVCPAGSMVETWARALRATTDVPVVTLQGTQQPAVLRRKFINAIQQNPNGYFVCHWESLRGLMTDSTFAETKWFHVIADEVHRAKNRKAQQTRALKRIRCFWRTAMSGTAADNHPQDLWSILNWLWPTVYTSYWKFYEHHLEYEVAYQGGQGYRKVKGVKNVDELHAFLEGKYRRRLKRDPAIALELPDKYYTRMYVPLSPQQRRAYDEMKSDFIAWVSTKKKESKGDELTPLMAQAVVAQLVRLQQLGVAYPGDIEEIRVWNKALAEKYNLVKPDPRGYEIRQKVVLTDPSSKIDTVLQILEDAPDDKQFVIFSQYRGAIDLLGARLAARGITHFALTGNTPQSERDQGVEDFQHSKTRCVIGTIKAGGVGITLHASSTVIFLDRDWSPSVNRQAEDRVDRIGQKHNVQIIDLIAPNTVDLGRHQRIDKKWSWIEKMLGDPESIRNMSEE